MPEFTALENEKGPFHGPWALFFHMPRLARTRKNKERSHRVRPVRKGARGKRGVAVEAQRGKTADAGGQQAGRRTCCPPPRKRHPARTHPVRPLLRSLSDAACHRNHPLSPLLRRRIYPDRRPREQVEARRASVPPDAVNAVNPASPPVHERAVACLTSVREPQARQTPGF